MMRRASCVVVVALTLVVGLTVAGTASAARQTSRTTAPGSVVTIYVTLSDRGIKYTMWNVVSPEGATELLVANSLLRGEVATFQVHNTGKKVHNFTAFGKKTPLLKAGARARFKVALLHRGYFHFQSTLDKTKKAFQGVFRVY